MYNAHFGFREKPFKLVPDPDYLYLSKNHEIALAHLTYAVSQGDGFVVITGEVGTGKTTLCRIFLERLDENVESAYIFNPKLESVELLTAVCDEFGIQTHDNNLKQLLDLLNDYLIKKNQAGRKVILLIDEAQNLSVENLELVRLLSNLETTRSKLLQIVLVGQPELGDKLDSYELRQLSQRISLSAHLTPLGFNETVGYIEHRIHVAAQRQLDLFTRGACRHIFRFSRGIPRLINIACDRSLLTAFSLNRNRVTTGTAKIAIQEVASRGRGQKQPVFKLLAVGVVFTFLAVLAAGLVYSQKESFWWARVKETLTTTVVQPPAGPPAAVEADEQPTFKITPRSAAEPAPDQPRIDPAAPQTEGGAAAQASGGEQVAAVIDTLGHTASRLESVARVLACWGQPPLTEAQLPAAMGDADYFEIAARQYGLRMYAVQSNWSLVKQLNLPGIVPIRKGPQTVYLALVGWQGGQIELAGPEGRGVIRTSLEDLLPHLSGPIYLYWKNALGFDGLIGSGAQGGQVTAVKHLLRRAGYAAISPLPVYDRETEQAVMDFQIRNRIEPDGLVGPLTKILLIRASGVVDFPRLDQNSQRGKA